MIKQTLFIIIIFLSFYFLNKNIRKLPSENNSSKIIIPDQYSQLLHFGQKELVSSLAWIDIIQNSNTDKDEIPFEFSRAIFISKLSPLFFINYSYNGTLISIAKDQFENSNNILKLGLKYFPNNYELLFQLGFNNYFLQNNLNEGLDIFKLIYDLNIYQNYNPLFPIIYSNLQKKSGQKELARRILYDLLINTDNKNLIKVIKNKLKN